MSEGPRLYMLQCGTLKTAVSAIKLNQGSDPFEIPVPWFLITHPKGNIIIDGGNAPRVAEDAAGHWGAGIAKAFHPTMTAEEAVLPQLQKLDVDPASVRWIVQSHLHLDHTGAVAVFEQMPNAQVLVTRREHEYSRHADWFAARSYVQADFGDHRIDWVMLEDIDDGYDLLGDGTLRCWHSPGHSPGHLSFTVSLPNSGTFLLAIDAVPTLDHWEEKALPGLMTSAIETVRTVKRLHRIAKREDATIVTGHDPVAWPAFTQAPGFYD
jgi:N-acyl homoserine lactone hydrolase